MTPDVPAPEPGDVGRGDGTTPAGEPRPLWRRLAKPLIVVAVSLAVGWIIIGLVGRIDWGQVAAALAKLSWWQAVPLAALLLLRQTANAVPLTRFVPGLRLRRSLQNDLSANLIATVAPPPGDVVLRVAMFRSWGVNAVDGMAGVTLNMLTFYVIRFLAPVLGLAAFALRGVERDQLLAALVSAAVAVTILAVLFLIARGDGLAALVGRAAATVVRRFRRSVDPEAWAMAVVDFRARMAPRLRGGLPPSLAALVAMVLVDGVLLLTSLRFVGVPAEALGAVEVLGAFLVAYPMTLLPFFGLGVLDATLVAGWVYVAGQETEPAIVAGLVVWRVTTLLGALGIGVVALTLWRRAHPDAHAALTA